MNARRFASSSALHCRRSQAGGAKLAYNRGTMARARSSITTCTTGWRHTRPTEIAMRRIASRPPKPRLSDRSLHSQALGAETRVAPMIKTLAAANDAAATACQREGRGMRVIR